MSIVFVLGFGRKPDSVHLRKLNAAIAAIRAHAAPGACWRSLSKLEAMRDPDASQHPILPLMQMLGKDFVLALCDTDHSFECAQIMDAHPAKTGHFRESAGSMADLIAQAANLADPEFVAIASHEDAPLGAPRYTSDIANGFAAWYRIAPWEKTEIDINRGRSLVHVSADRAAIFQSCRA